MTCLCGLALERDSRGREACPACGEDYPRGFMRHLGGITGNAFRRWPWVWVLAGISTIRLATGTRSGYAFVPLVLVGGLALSVAAFRAGRDRARASRRG